MPFPVIKIISGGQTGVDRAALDFAIEHGLTHGGWCPKGRKAEDGRIPARYRLRQTRGSDYKERTLRNVLKSDATVIFTRKTLLFGGTKFTQKCALLHGRPLLVLRQSLGPKRAAQKLSRWLRTNEVKVLNVAGPRESQAPQLARFVKATLERLTVRAPRRLLR